MNKLNLIFLAGVVSFAFWSQAEVQKSGKPKLTDMKSEKSNSDHSHDDDHDHATESKEAHAGDHDDHDKEDGGGHNHAEKGEGHAHGSEGHAEEESGNVGPDKGILEANEEKGFKLSPQALKNFELKTQKISGTGPWKVPQSAKLFSGEEINIYRLRAGFFKRIDFNTLSKTSQHIYLRSKDLRSNDEIVVSGIGFLRIAELAAFGGAPTGHSH